MELGCRVRGFPAPGPSGGEGISDRLGMWFWSTSEVRRQLGQIMNWEEAIAGTEDGNAIL